MPALLLAMAVLTPACGVIGIPADKSSAASEIRIAIRQISSLDPAHLNNAGALLAGRQLFEPLVTFDPKNLQLKPALARRWEVLDQGSRFVFHLRPGAKFHNGQEVTAEDVVFSLNRLARRETASEVAFLLDQIQGFQGVNESGDVPDLQGLRVVDPLTVEVRLVASWYDFPYVLTSPATAPIPQAALLANPDGFATAPVGAGPYRLPAPFERGDDFSLDRFPGYWGRSPAISTISFLLYDQIASSWKDFQSGLVDISEVPPGSISSAQARYGKAGFSPVAATVYLGFNVGEVPDPRVRRAVSMAIDRRSIAHDIYDNVLLPADSLVPPGLRISRGACAGDCKHDPETARALVRQAYPAGDQPPIAFDYQVGGPQEELAKALQVDLAEAGVTITPRPTDLPGLFDRLDSGGQELFRLGWAADYPLADWFLTPLFRSASDVNYTGLADPEIDAMITRARSEPNQNRRAQLYRSLERMELRTLSIIPIGYFRNRFAASENVRGFYADRLGGFQVSRLRMASE